MEIAIQAENISKVYQLGEIGTGTISRDIERRFARITGKEDPFMKLADVNNISGKSSADMVWSLKNINFEIMKGDAVGIIGRNGAGKSTLLKILSRITSPTTGRVRGNGRVASLLEIGTGFHPELTGRENIFLNGSILGMRKKEISRKFDEIVDFSGIERYVDTPVRRYSSGMYTRLAFAVAAHLESEILIVDEVLAVGDAEFQRKCLGKMNDVSRGEGRTVLFVSHNMQAIQNLCTKGIVLDKGLEIFNGNILDAITSYSQINMDDQIAVSWQEGYFENNVIDILSAKIGSADQQKITTDSEIEIDVSTNIKKEGANILIDLCLYNQDGILVFDVVSHPDNFKAGKYSFKCIIPSRLLNAGNYSIDLFAVQNHTSILFSINKILQFDIGEGWRPTEYYSSWPGIIRPSFNWHITKDHTPPAISDPRN